MELSANHPSRVKLILVVVVIAAITTVGLLAYYFVGTESEAAEPESAEVEHGTVSLTASASGTVTPVREWSLGFEADAEITELSVAAGDQVTKGQVLAASDDADAAELVSEADSALEEAEDELDEAETDVDDCRTAMTGQAGGTAAAQTDCQSTGTDAILNAQQRVNQAESDLVSAQDALDATVITAPADATVLSVSATEGTVLSAGTALIVLGDLSSVTVESAFSEADAAALTVGHTVAVTVGDEEESIETQISAIALAGSASDGLVTFAVSIGLAEPPESVRSGSTARVDAVLASVADVLYVPVSALTAIEDDTAEVTVLADDGTEATRSVTTGLFGNSAVEIRTGLEEGERVLLGQ